MTFDINLKEAKEIINNIYFLEEIWTESNNVYELLNLDDMIENKKVTKKTLMNIENKLSELNKHYEFYIKNKLNEYKHDEKLRIVKYNLYIKNIHKNIEQALYKSC